MDERDWDATIDRYLKSVWLCMKYEILEMLKRGGGVIVHNSSVDGSGVRLSRNSHQCGMPRVGSDTTGRARMKR